MGNKPIYCSVLSNGDTIIYTIADNGNWEEPCRVFVGWQDDKTPTLKFDPFALFSNANEMPPINPNHILITYTPDSDVEHNYHSFVEAYHTEIKRRLQ